MIFLPITHYPLPITHYPLPITHWATPLIDINILLGCYKSEKARERSRAFLALAKRIEIIPDAIAPFGLTQFLQGF